MARNSRISKIKRKVSRKISRAKKSVRDRSSM